MMTLILAREPTNPRALQQKRLVVVPGVETPDRAVQCRYALLRSGFDLTQ